MLCHLSWLTQLFPPGVWGACGNTVTSEDVCAMKFWTCVNFFYFKRVYLQPQQCSVCENKIQLITNELKDAPWPQPVPNIPALPGMLPGFPLGVWGQALVLLKDTVLKGNSEMTTDSFVGLWSLVQLKKSFHCNHFWPVWWLSFPPPAPILSFPLNVL